jgi:hypothetical protein
MSMLALHPEGRHFWTTATNEVVDENVLSKCALLESEANNALQECRNQSKRYGSYDHARSVAAQSPMFPGINVDPAMKKSQGYQSQRQWAIGARHAYATAIVIFLDILFKRLWSFYSESLGLSSTLLLL